MSDRSMGVAVAAIALATFLWSTNIFLGKLLLDALPPLTLSFLRQLACLAVAIPMVILAPPAVRARAVADWRPMAAIGLLAFAVPHSLIYLALQQTSTINVAILNALLPALVIAFSLAFLGSRATPRQLIGILLSGCGALLIILSSTGSALTNFSIGRGELLALAGMSSAAGYTVLVASLKREMPPAALLAVGSAAGTALLLPGFAYELLMHMSMRLDTSIVMGIIYIGVFPSAVSMLAWNRAISILGPGRTSQGVHLIPVFSTLLAITFLGEQLHLHQLSAAVLIVAGVMLANLGSNPKRRA